MQFESLRVFCDIARLRSFSQAAALHDMTQSAASQIVHMLETRLGGQLIDRSTRPLHLTPLGRAYYEGCRKLVEEYLALEARLKEDRATLSATVVVAAIYSVSLSDLGEFKERFRALQPTANVSLEYLHPDEVYDKVHQGTADFGLVSFPRKGRDLNVLPWREEPMVLACAPRHPLASRPRVRAVDLHEQTYIGFNRALVIRRQVDRFLRAHHVIPQVVLEFDNIESIKRAVEDNAGIALLPEPTVRREVAAGTLVARPLEGQRFLRPLGVIYRRHHDLSSFALRFMELLRENSPTAFTDFGQRKLRSLASSDRTTPPAPRKKG
jgi:DNA-binding transcriptional LysR family regulator